MRPDARPAPTSIAAAIAAPSTHSWPISTNSAVTAIMPHMNARPVIGSTPKNCTGARAYRMPNATVPANSVGSRPSVGACQPSARSARVPATVALSAVAPTNRRNRRGPHHCSSLGISSQSINASNRSDTKRGSRNGPVKSVHTLPSRQTLSPVGTSQDAMRALPSSSDIP